MVVFLGFPDHCDFYPTAYCTGLLLARRHLKNFELDQDYVGNETVSAYSQCVLLSQQFW